MRIESLGPNEKFGARVSGLTLDIIEDEAVRADLNELFEERGLIVFQVPEPSGELQVAVSKVFGSLKDHPVPSVARVDSALAPGVIEIRQEPGRRRIVEFGGRQYSSWLPWHFDHCYNNELNRAGVLRCVEGVAHGGLTGFVDGVELYHALSPELRKRIEGCNIIYTLNLAFADMRFGLPEDFREIEVTPGLKKVLEHAKTLPRAIHPAVWERSTGEKVLHISPWMAVGIEGREDPEGDALFDSVCKEIISKLNPYYHQWQPNHMVIWDNWRMLHGVTGHDPDQRRVMHRTTIKGDYGLGYFEDGRIGDKLLEMTV